MAAAVIDLGRMAPFFFASLCVIPREETEGLGGLVVSPETIYYDPAFVLETERPELCFYLMHGIYHIMMMHHIRGNGRETVRWNLACDVYINSCIYHSFGVKPGGAGRPVTGPGGETAFLKMPESEPLIEDINVKEDTPEMIYYWFQSDDESETGKKLKKLKASGNGRLDLIDDEKSRQESESVKQRTALRLKKKVETIYDQIRPTDAARGKADEDIAVSAGGDENLIDWTVVLRSRLTALEKDEKSLSTPDRRFAHTGLYVEGPVIEEDALTEVKVCIDTSGSMTDAEIASALYQIHSILKQYRTEAELVFWDEDIESAMPFENLHQLHLAESKAAGRGGTNPDCLFAYFSRRSRHRYRGEKPRLLLIFTDGYFDLPDRKYAAEFGSETIWVIMTDQNKRWKHQAPAFGKTAYMKKPGDYRKMIQERIGNGDRDTEHADGNNPGDYLTN